MTTERREIWLERGLIYHSKPMQPSERYVRGDIADDMLEALELAQNYLGKAYPCDCSHCATHRKAIRCTAQAIAKAKEKDQ